PAVYEANLANAQANLQATRSLAERYKQLIDEQAVSKQEYDDANAKRLQAEAALKSAQIDLRYTKVLAPISGRIGRSAFTEGALVSNGQT
ncbi:efflux transporter periplasmic adaptor subunit, partial [Pantoea sp. SIMBA_072]